MKSEGWAAGLGKQGRNELDVELVGERVEFGNLGRVELGMIWLEK